MHTITNHENENFMQQAFGGLLQTIIHEKLNFNVCIDLISMTALVLKLLLRNI